MAEISDKQAASWSSTLRQAAIDSGETCYKLAQETGIGETRLRRFIAGTSGLSVSATERLATRLGYRLTRRKHSAE